MKSFGPRKLVSVVLMACLSTTGIASAQQTDESAAWLAALDKPRNANNQLRGANFIDKFASFDFAPVLRPRVEFLGYIGDEYQRLHVTLFSVERDPGNLRSYLVTGETWSTGPKMGIRGEISIVQVREYAHLHFGVDDEFKNKGIRHEGVVIGRYDFKEVGGNLGRYEGVVTALWLVDSHGKLRRDSIEESYSDSYINNQYVGRWAKDDGAPALVANWGEYRIPFSDPLDIGSAEFAPDPKYGGRGWGDFSR